MRIVSACVMFVALATVTPPDSSALRARFGKPILGRYTVRPGITMTVEYGSDHKACDLQIEPANDFRDELSAAPGPTMSRKTAMDILNQVVPETRGKKFTERGSFQSSCVAGKLMTYENISISLAGIRCEAPMRVQVLGVQFNRDACPNRPPAVVRK